MAETAIRGEQRRTNAPNTCDKVSFGRSVLEGREDPLPPQQQEQFMLKSLSNPSLVLQRLSCAVEEEKEEEETLGKGPFYSHLGWVFSKVSISMIIVLRWRSRHLE